MLSKGYRKSIIKELKPSKYAYFQILYSGVKKTAVLNHLCLIIIINIFWKSSRTENPQFWHFSRKIFEKEFSRRNTNNKCQVCIDEVKFDTTCRDRYISISIILYKFSMQVNLNWKKR